MADLVGGMLDFVSTFDVRQKRVRRGEVLDDFNKKLRLLACQIGLLFERVEIVEFLLKRHCCPFSLARQ